MNEKEKREFYSHFVLESASSRIFQAFLDASNLQEFVDEVADIINNPVLVVDNVFKVLAGSNAENIGDEVWKDAVRMGYYSDELILEILDNSSEEDVLIQNHNPFERGPLLSSYKRMISRLVFRGSAYGSLVVLCVNETPPETWELLPFISDLVVKLAGIDRQDVAFRDSRFYETVFIDLLRGNIQTHSMLESRSLLAGMDNTAKYFQLLTIPIHPSARITAGSLKRGLEGIFGNSWIIFYEDHLLTLRFSSKPLFKADFPWDKVNELMAPYKLPLCCSDPFTELLRLPEHYRRNERAILLAEWTRDGDLVFSYDRYKFIDLALSAVNYDENALRGFISEPVASILEYDKANGTDYFQTLLTFLESEKSFVLTAKKLFTHKNTIAYRIGRMKELFSFDLNSSEETFSLMYSCVLVKYQKAISANRAPKLEKDG